MQIWLPDEIITDSNVDQKFRDFIKSKIGMVRRKGMKRQKATIKMPKFSIEYSDDIIQ